MQVMSSGLVLSIEYHDSDRLSSGLLLPSNDAIQSCAWMPNGHIQHSHETGRGEGLHVLHGGSLLRVYGSDSSDGGMSCGLLLWGRIQHLDSVPVSDGECELCGRDVCGCDPRDGQRHLSSGPLLSGGI